MATAKSPAALVSLVADEKKGPRPIPRPVIRLLFLMWAVVVLFFWVAGFWVLMLEEPDRGLGFGLLGLATVVMLAIGWKFRWLQKRGLMGAPPAP